MTAAGGILHDEFHSPAFCRNGGTLEMVQLWVNLPAAHKMSAPRYQTLLNADIPQIELNDAAGSVRVIAGAYATHAGPAGTFSPLNVWDLRVKAGRSTRLSIAEGHTAILAVLHGAVSANGSRQATAAELLLFDGAGDAIDIAATSDSTVLLLSGAPLDEPIVGYGPFVMNSRQQIETAMNDFRAGRFGRMSAPDLTAAPASARIAAAQ
jgi:quercetin 2,3-dioxygenase